MRLPDIGPNLPRLGNRLTRTFALGFLTRMGWTVEGAIPNRPQLLMIVAPHTSNWDFLFGIAAAFALGLRVHWLAKDTLFKGPWGPVLEMAGGIPVNRREPQGVIDQLAERFQEQEKLVMCITPEGTRKRVDRWKSGFYRLALRSGVPLVPVFLDYGKKTVGIGPILTLTGKGEIDFERILDFYRSVRPRYPDRFNPDPELPSFGEG